MVEPEEGDPAPLRTFDRFPQLREISELELAASQGNLVVVQALWPSCSDPAIQVSAFKMACLGHQFKVAEWLITTTSSLKACLTPQFLQLIHRLNFQMEDQLKQWLNQ